MRLLRARRLARSAVRRRGPAARSHRRHLPAGLQGAPGSDATTLREAIACDDGPTALRFPKGAGGDDIPAVDTFAGIDVLHRGERPDLLLVSVGAMAATCLEVAGRLAAQGLGVTVVDPRWVKPVTPELVGLALEHRLVATVEDNGRVGGVGAHIAQALSDAGAALPVRVFGIPQHFLDHGSRSDVLEASGLTPRRLTHALLESLPSGWQARRGATDSLAVG
ncbi:hypothetical protein H4N64_22720 [Streptomyces sp. PSKA01]|uniref:Transketolase C-terminal domain-containing protein n=1 Tax=Streptomyces cupreus TaxID=2759956 RepID=A0A7X1MAJ8_9ACTN|nr:hypothetical protein [Streptomyces cupreus]